MTKVLFFFLAFLFATALSAPAPEEPKDLDTGAGEKGDLQTAASGWGGYGWGGYGWGGYGYGHGLGGYGYGWGYPHYGYGWGYPGYGYYGHGWPYYHGYWW
ncbi:keratin-associated protein 19-1-like [Aricia agestis]|uniref:keratin-associated protein 19-1-like n=1 Tax=Aricia agestis TaxID=91739 RepID=UPI001C20A15D|nr:keratin-associated protein 19-1-like [Aricia agestis]